MNIVDKAIEKYVTVIICALALMFGGMYVFTQMPMQKRPDMDFPRVTVVTTMAGANATIMDSDVADVLEDSLSGISGVMSLTTSSYPGRSVTIVEFDMEKNINDAASDVRFDKPEYDIKLNRGLTDIMNVDVRALSTELYSIFGGKKVTKETEVLRIADIDTIKASMEIPEMQLGLVKPGMQVQVTYAGQ